MCDIPPSGLRVKPLPPDLAESWRGLRAEFEVAALKGPPIYLCQQTPPEGLSQQSRFGDFDEFSKWLDVKCVGEDDEVLHTRADALGIAMGFRPRKARMGKPVHLLVHLELARSVQSGDLAPEQVRAADELAEHFKQLADYAGQLVARSQILETTTTHGPNHETWEHLLAFLAHGCAFEPYRDVPLRFTKNWPPLHRCVRDRGDMLLLEPNVFAASVAAIDLFLAVRPSHETGEQQLKSPKRRGRKKADYETTQKEAALAAEWNKARESRTAKVDFVRDHGMGLKDFDRLLNRVYRRANYKQKTRSDK